jgi:hypothetical protein
MKKPADVVTARIEQKIAELRVLACTTAVLWGRSPDRPFEQIVDEAQDSTARFVERTRRALSAPAESPGTPTINVGRARRSNSG